MPFETSISLRPVAQVYLENAPLAVCVIAFVPVCLTVIGLLAVRPLLTGLRNSLRDRNDRSVRHTAAAVQIAVLFVGIVMAGLASNHYSQMAAAKNAHASFLANFPNKWELELHSSIEPYMVALTYGAEVSNRVGRIYLQHLSEAHRLLEPIDENRAATIW